MAELHGFELVREQEIPEIKTLARLYRHFKTGAELLSLINDDENKCFGIAFRTPPRDSTGVAHILEHAVLSGSRKYPLKDPFAELLKSSLQTFLNAITYPDKTVYPVASTNLQDFYNLVDVYLDTVFNPLLRRETFLQEGWHYELEPDGRLTYKGVVFNEMKGAYSSPDSLLSRFTQQAVFPDTTYGVDSGGNPTDIPNLTYEAFTEFHHALYHPSNARIFFYGNDDPTERLRLLDAYLSAFERQEPNSEIALQPRFDAPRRVERLYAGGPEADGQRKTYVNIAWMLGEPTDTETDLALGILEHILIGTPAAPLRKALIDSGLGENLTGSGLTDSLRQVAFWVGLKNIAGDSVEAVERLTLETLERLAREGIDPATVAASLNTVEFALRENNTGSFPRGLSLMLRALDTWLYGGDPLAPLMFEAPLAAIKARVAAGERYFEGLIERFFLANPHRITVVLRPDPELAARESAEERARLDAARAAMDERALEAIAATAKALREMQETPDPPEKLALLPTLKLSDIERAASTIPCAIEERAGVRTLYHDLFTNGIAYLDIGMDLHALPQDLLPYVPLFGRALVELGTAREGPVQLLQRIGRETGGIRPQVLVTSIRDSDHSAAWLFLRGKATLAQTPELLAILRDVLLTARLDNRERFRQMVLESKAGLEGALAPSGHGFVNSRLRSRFNEADWASELLGGVSYLEFLRRLAEQVDRDWPAVEAALERMRTLLVRRGGMIANATLDADGWAQLGPRLEAFLAALPGGAAAPAAWAPQMIARNEGLAIPAQVNFVGKGADLYRLGYRLHGSVLVISNYLRNVWLWEKVRQQGGAYGGFCAFDQRSGVFTFLSYRDPNLLGTLDVYDRTAACLRRLDLSDEELSRNIIGAIGDLDAYQLPDAKGFTALVRYLVGDTDEQRQRFRDEVLGTTAADFRAFADVLDRLSAEGAVVVMGGRPALEAALAEQPGLFEIKTVL
jgi:Zn-dependent M16 (insulinase) family peptidase